MRIAYFDFNCSSFYEDYSAVDPEGYGGGSTFGRWARILLNDDQNNFFLFAPAECFRNIKTKEDRPDKCIPVDKNVLMSIRAGVPISSFFNLDKFDIICHHNTCEHSITKGSIKAPLVQWSGFGDGAAISFGAEYALLYHKGKSAPFSHQKVKYVKIGKPVPKEFQEFKKFNYVFQCSRHDDLMGSIEVAKKCKENGIVGIFAGPIHNGYKLLDYIDNTHTFYLGSIDEKQKMDLYKDAAMFTLLANWDVPFNQSIIEAQGVGTPVLVNRIGPFLSEYVKPDKNGFFYNGSNFLDCFRKVSNIKQIDCWVAAREYSVEEMVGSFKRAFEEIICERQN